MVLIKSKQNFGVHKAWRTGEEEFMRANEGHGGEATARAQDGWAGWVKVEMINLRWLDDLEGHNM